jgi:hypothetical protein
MKQLTAKRPSYEKEDARHTSTIDIMTEITTKALGGHSVVLNCSITKIYPLLSIKQQLSTHT